MYKIYISAVIIFNTCIIADETSVDEMIDFIVQEQFLSTQEKTMRDSMYTMMETMGLKVKSKTFDDFLDPLIKEYLSGIQKKVPALYKDIYTEEEILALYNFMKTVEGISINKKQSLVIEKSMIMISDDAMKLGQSIAIALQENPELLESILE